MEVELHPVDDKTVKNPEDRETIEQTDVVPIEPKRRGRPPGAKNKTKAPKTEPEELPEPNPILPIPKRKTKAPKTEPEETPEPILPISKRKKKIVVESESESEEEPIRRKKTVSPPPDSPRTTQLKLQTNTAKLRQEYHNQRVEGYTNLLNEMLLH
jgi:hypothetical protein